MFLKKFTAKTFLSVWNNILRCRFIILITACLLINVQCFLCLAQNDTEQSIIQQDVARQDVARQDVAQQIEEIIYYVYEDLFYSQPDSALLLLEQAAQTAQDHQLWDSQIGALLQAAWCAEYHSQLDTFQYYLNQTEQLVRQHAEALDTLDPEGLLATDVAYTRGSFYYSIGDFSSTISAFDNIVQPQALARTTDSLLVTDVFIYLGNAYYRLQNYQKSLDHYRIASEWLPQTAEDPNYNREYRQALNSLYQAKSLYTTAHYNQQPEAYTLGKSLIEQALTYFLAQRNTPRFQNPIRSGANILASIYRDQQQYDSTLYYLSVALATHTEKSTLLINTYQEMGATYALMQHYSKAREAYNRSLQLAEELLPAKHYQRANVYLHQGQLLATQNDWQGALEKYQQALGQLVTEFTAEANILENPLYQDAGAKKELLEVLAYKAKALWGLYQQQPESTSPLESALEIYHLIGNILDEMRQGFPSIEYRQFVASHFFEIYEQAIRVAYEMHQLQPADDQFLAEAFYFVEKSKSFILLEATQKIQAQSFGGVPDSLLEQERAHARKISILEQQLNDLPDAASSEATQVQQQLLVARRIRQDLLQQFEQNYPDYYALRHNTEVASLTDVQANLPNNTVLLTYFMGDSSLFAMGISRNKVIVNSIASFRNFEQNLTHFLPFVRQYNLEDTRSSEARLKWAQSAYALYQQLVGSSLDSLGVQPEKLIIIPDGQLGYLPFDVLLTQEITETKSANFSALPYLIKELPLRYEYSSSLYMRQAPATEALSGQYAYAGFAPKYESPPLLAENTTRSGNAPEVFYDLLYNTEEVEQAARLFDSQVFTNKNATERAFREFAPQSNLLHLSMHAFAHDEDPMHSGLVFSQTDTATEDNFLYAHELYNLQLQADLAVLSACETGVGQLARGEGIMSLGRAFKYAGCPNVAMSLWKVNDRTTQQIVQSFFEELAAGSDKDVALQQAKLSFLGRAKGPLSHPYYWASLALIGDDQSLDTSTSSIFWWLFIGLGSLLLIVSIALIAQKKRSNSAT